MKKMIVFILMFGLLLVPATNLFAEDDNYTVRDAKNDLNECLDHAESNFGELACGVIYIIDLVRAIFI